MKTELSFPSLLANLWGKTKKPKDQERMIHPLICHMIDVGIIVQELLCSETFKGIMIKLKSIIKSKTPISEKNTIGSKFISDEPNLLGMVEFTNQSLLAIIGWIVSLHDIGKCDSIFQVKVSTDFSSFLSKMGLITSLDKESGKYHTDLGKEFIKTHLKNLKCDKKTFQLIGGITLGHHGHFTQNTKNSNIFHNREKKKTEKEIFWYTNQIKFFELTQQIFQSINLNVIEFKDASSIGIILEGLIVIADWTGSNEYMYPYYELSKKIEPKINKIKSTSDYSEYIEIYQFYMKIARIEAQHLVKNLGFNYSLPWQKINQFHDLWPSYNILFPIQTYISDYLQQNSQPGLMIIEAPMGEGKTEAALFVASQWMKKTSSNGFYFALPTMATSNQMFQRITKFLNTSTELHSNGEKSSQVFVKLIHGMAWVVDELIEKIDNYDEGYDQQFIGEISEKSSTKNQSQYAYWWFMPSRRALLSQFGVGTVDQAMRGSLWVKYGFLRLMGLTSKILIIDEIHAYDAYMMHILKRLLHWLSVLKIPVIMLSATLPQKMKEDLIVAYSPEANMGSQLSEMNSISDVPYPLITHVNFSQQLFQYPSRMLSNEEIVDNNSKIIEIKLHNGFIDNYHPIIELINSIIEQEKCIAIICNTVVAAQELYAEIKKEYGQGQQKPQIMLFHSRYRIQDRFKIEEKVLSMFDKEGKNRPNRAILVATQIIEQSLDLDFDEMITELAPLDLLLQRCGRLHRHKRKSRVFDPVFHILLPNFNIFPYNFGRSKYVYPEILLFLSWIYLKGNKQFNLPADFRRSIEFVYRKFPEDLSLFFAELDILDKNKKNYVEKIIRTYIELTRSKSIKPEQFLIPPPNTEKFSFLYYYESLFVDGEESNSYLIPQTRDSQYTTQILALTKNEFIDFIQLKKKKPKKAIVQNLMYRSVKVPSYWLNSKISPQNAKGEIILNPPKWLPGISKVLCFSKFLDASNKGFINEFYQIFFNKEIGFYKQNQKKEL